MSRVLIFFLGSLFGSIFSFASSLSVVPSNVRFEQHLEQKLPLNVRVVDEYNQEKPLSTYFGKTPVIVVFTYFRCKNLCTLVLNGLVQSLKGLPETLGKHYQVLTISISPVERASLALAKKKSYLAKLGEVQKNTAWHFLTGQSTEIRKLANLAGFYYEPDLSSGEYAHPSGIIVVSPQGKITQYFFGIQFSSKELHQALSIASREKKGSWIEEILIFCFHYDPKLSTNGPLIMKIIRGAGVLGLLSIVLFLAYLFSTPKGGQGSASVGNTQ